MSVDDLAMALHEAGRAAVAAGAMVNPNTHARFLEWDEIEEKAREGRRIQARYLLDRFTITPRNIK